MTSKANLRATAHNSFQSLDKSIKAAIDSRERYRTRVAALKNGEPRYEEEYLKGLLDKEGQRYSAERQSLWSGVSEALESLRASLNEAHNTLELTPELLSAVGLIKSLGEGLAPENMTRINSQFAGDQAALRLLRDAYATSGARINGGLSNMIYDGPAAVDAAAQRAFQAFMRDGSLNNFAADLARIAGFEGESFESLPDQVGWLERARAGAGLGGQVRVNEDGSIEVN